MHLFCFKEVPVENKRTLGLFLWQEDLFLNKRIADVSKHRLVLPEMTSLSSSKISLAISTDEKLHLMFNFN